MYLELYYYDKKHSLQNSNKTVNSVISVTATAAAALPELDVSSSPSTGGAAIAAALPAELHVS